MAKDKKVDTVEASTVTVKLTDETKKALLALGKKTGKSKEQVIEILLPEFKVAYKDATVQGWLTQLEDEDEKQGAIMDIMNSRYLLGKSKARMDFTVFVTRQWGKQISRQKQEKYGKIAGFILGEKNELTGFCLLTGKGSDADNVSQMEEGQAYEFKAGILASDGAFKAMIREDEEDEIQSKVLENFKVTSKAIIDILPSPEIVQLLDMVKPDKETIHALKVTVGDVAKFREKPGAFLKCHDASLMGDDELRESMGGFSIAVPEDCIYGPGARLTVICRTYQKTKKGTGFKGSPAEPEGFPQADALYVLATLPVPWSLNKKAKKGAEQVEEGEDLEKEVKEEKKAEDKEEEDPETDGME